MGAQAFVERKLGELLLQLWLAQSEAASLGAEVQRLTAAEGSGGAGDAPAAGVDEGDR